MAYGILATGQRRAALYGSASTITWSYSLDVLYVSYTLYEMVLIIYGI